MTFTGSLVTAHGGSTQAALRREADDEPLERDIESNNAFSFSRTALEEEMNALAADARWILGAGARDFFFCGA
jgi:hypothetical protein